MRYQKIINKINKLMTLIVATGVVWGAGCVSVKPVMLDRKTQLENQILGTFQRLEEELILASSVRGGEGKKMSPEAREAAEALMTREYFRDDIEAYKDKQALGEGSNAMLVLLKAPDDAGEAARLRRMVDEENRARQVIVNRVIQLGRDLNKRDLPLVRRMLYRLNSQAARPGQMVQQLDGRWMAKGGGV